MFNCCFHSFYLRVFPWHAVTSETGHATGMPKTGHAIWYFMDS